MSSTSLNDSSAVHAGNVADSSPNSLPPSGSSERLSLDSNGSTRKVNLYNSSSLSVVTGGDERPNSVSNSAAAALRPANSSIMLHSPNNNSSNNNNRSLTSPSTTAVGPGQMPMQSHGRPLSPTAVRNLTPNSMPGPGPGQQHLQMTNFANGPPPPLSVPPGHYGPMGQPPVPQHQFPGYAPPPPHHPHAAPPGSQLPPHMSLMPHPMNMNMNAHVRPSLAHQFPGQLGHPHAQLIAQSLGGLPGQPPLGIGPLSMMPGHGMGLTHRIPSSDDACASIVHSLMDHRQGGDSEQFTKRAVESLVKKLRERKEELEALIFAVTTGGAQRTRCVTIQRTLDGRLQVAGKKGFPHVIYSKIWRWPDLHKNELRHVNSCQYAFDLKLDNVCVNPYHYERVVSPCPDLVPLGSAANNEEPSPAANSSFHQQHPYDTRSPNNSASPESPLGAPAGSGVFQSPYIQSATLPPVSGEETPSHQQPSSGFSNGSFSSVQQPGPPVYPPPASSLAFKVKPPPLATPLELWCTINYFELNVQVGQPFKVPFDYCNVIVDGFTDPNGVNRFCLGCLSNVHRDEVVERARPHIGKGVELRHDDDGDVWLKVLSQHSVFLQSPYLDSQCGRGTAVHKIYSAAELKVFDLKYCYQQMYDQTQLVHLAKNMLRASVKNTSGQEVVSTPQIGVDDYQRHCVLRLSFVKGYGPDYNRKRIEDTPCWIEVKLHWPLKLLDQLLQPLDDPQYQAQPTPQPPPPPPQQSTPQPQQQSQQQPQNRSYIESSGSHTQQINTQHNLHSHVSPSTSTDNIGPPATTAPSLLYQS